MHPKAEGKRPLHLLTTAATREVLRRHGPLATTSLPTPSAVSRSKRTRGRSSPLAFVEQGRSTLSFGYPRTASATIKRTRGVQKTAIGSPSRWTASASSTPTNVGMTMCRWKYEAATRFCKKKRVVPELVSSGTFLDPRSTTRNPQPPSLAVSR